MKRDLEKIQKSESKVRVLLSHTVLHSNSAVLHDVNAYHITNSGLVVIFYIDFCQNRRFNS